MKSQLCSIVCLLVLAACVAEARPKRSVIYATAPVVASVPVAVHSAVVHSNPTTVVKTEQVRSGDHASYSYHSEVKTEPHVVHTHTHAATAVAAAPVAVAAAPVVTTHHHTVAAAAVPTAYHYGYYPAAYSYYSPYSYVVGK